MMGTKLLHRFIDVNVQICSLFLEFGCLNEGIEEVVWLGRILTHRAPILSSIPIFIPDEIGVTIG